MYIDPYEALGYEAAKSGAKKEDNPYPQDSSSFRNWNYGFNKGINEMVPAVGTKGYYSIGSDTYPITVVKVSKSGKKIWCRDENFVGGEGHDYFGTQNWDISENPNGAIKEYWYSETKKRYQSGGCGYVGFTGWYAKQDPHF